MQNVSIQKAGDLPQAVKSAVEHLLGRSIAPDEEISVAAVPPQHGSTLGKPGRGDTESGSVP